MFKHEDINIKYFHAYANQRKAKNHIKCIVDEQNVAHDQIKSIEEAFWSYFTKLFTTADPSSQDIVRCTTIIQHKVNEDINRRLLQKFTPKEV